MDEKTISPTDTGPVTAADLPYINAIVKKGDARRWAGPKLGDHKDFARQENYRKIRAVKEPSEI